VFLFLVKTVRVYCTSQFNDMKPEEEEEEEKFYEVLTDKTIGM
jgi:hypothetical protein